MSPFEEKYITLNKKVGQTPLEVLENWRATKPELADTPLAYAGRLDPMASGLLLVLIGEECKKQTEYHNLDKEYQVGILFGVETDSGDVLGIVREHNQPKIIESYLTEVLNKTVGEIEFPYPAFSAKTVQGKPLHTWAMEGRLDEIAIPTKKSEIYSLRFDSIKSFSRKEIAEFALRKIELIPPVTDERKALGNDFRRPDIREGWNTFAEKGAHANVFYMANITCVCSSGTYMRTLAEVIASKLNTKGLAYSINRTKVGIYNKSAGVWTKNF